MTAITTTSVTVASAGDTTITINDGVDMSRIKPSSVIFIEDSGALLVCSSGTAASGGKSTITLSAGFPSGVTLPTGSRATILIGYDALAEMAGDLTRHVTYSSDVGQLVDQWATTDNEAYVWKKLDGSTITVKTLPALERKTLEIQTAAESQLNTLSLPKAADFEARKQARLNNPDRKRSGVINPGKHHSEATTGNFAKIGEGLWCGSDNSYRLFLGRVDSGTNSGKSKTFNPVFDINGIEVNLSAADYTVENQNSIPFPEAITPSVEATTTTTINYNPHDWIVTGNDAYCCIAAATAGDLLTDTSKFLHSPEGVVRTNLVGLEVYQVKLTGTDKRPFYPRGNIQNGQTSYEGVTMSATSGLGISDVDANYTRFGEWDTSTDGLGADWESLTVEQRDSLASQPENNIYVGTDGAVYQWHVRVRVIRGFGPKWQQTGLLLTDTASDNWVAFNAGAHQRVSARGAKNESSDFVVGDSSIDLFATARRESNTYSEMGRVETPSAGLSANSECYFLPLMLVTQGNTGAYHKFLNEWGCSAFASSSNGGVSINTTKLWYQDFLHGIAPTTLADCCNRLETYDSVESGYASWTGHIASTSGNASGRPDGEFYDAIYPWQVQDLRLSAFKNQQGVNEISHQATSNQIRGSQGMPTTRFSETLKIRQGGTNSGYPWYRFKTISESEVGASSYLSISDVNFVYNVTQSHLARIVQFDSSSDSSSAAYFSTKELNYTPINDKSLADDFAPQVDDEIILISVSESDVPVNGEYPHTDFIGLPTNIKTILDSFSVDFVFGQWIPTIPDGTSKTYKASEKAEAYYGRVYTTDNGVSWVGDSNPTFDPVNSTNSYYIGHGSSTVQHINYTAHANAFEPCDRLSVDGQELSKVKVSNSHWAVDGSVFCSHTIGAIPTNGAGKRVHVVGDLSYYAITSDGLLNNGINFIPSHDEITLENDSPGFKAAFYKHADDNEFPFAVAMVKGLAYDAGWTDNNQIEPTDGQTLMESDSAGIYVTVGTYKTKQPLQGF